MMLQAAQYAVTADSGERDGAGPASTGLAAAPTAAAKAISNCRLRLNMSSPPVPGLIELQSPGVRNRWKAAFGSMSVKRMSGRPAAARKRRATDIGALAL